MTELLEALYREDRARVDELLAGEPELSVFEAAAFGRIARLEGLLDADPALANAYGDDGFQPLGLACFFGHVAAAKLLLDRGADPNTLSRNERIQTAGLHAAAASVIDDEAVRIEFCTLLLAAGADPNLRQGGGSRPIDAARHNRDTKLEELLRANGAED